jgi:hypothetical protein
VTEGKACAIVAMGVTNHHFLGAERHPRDILAFYGPVTAPAPSLAHRKHKEEKDRDRAKHRRP